MIILEAYILLIHHIKGKIRKLRFILARIVAGNNGASLLSLVIDGQNSLLLKQKPPHDTYIN